MAAACAAASCARWSSRFVWHRLPTHSTTNAPPPGRPRCPPVRPRVPHVLRPFQHTKHGDLSRCMHVSKRRDPLGAHLCTQKTADTFVPVPLTPCCIAHGPRAFADAGRTCSQLTGWQSSQDLEPARQAQPAWLDLHLLRSNACIVRMVPVYRDTRAGRCPACV